MLADEGAARRVDILVEQYIEARHRKHDFVSLKLAIVAIRQVSRFPISDDQLARIVAARAVQSGLDVRFDQKANDNAL